MQFDSDHKGFSFSKEAFLDMRMDPSSRVTAKEIVNSFSEEKLGTIFREYGEESYWKKAAKAIVIARRKKPIETTEQLATLILSVIGFKKRGRLHPATLIFQALRIAVNNELASIQIGLTKALQFLSKEGRMGVISFHSLEDRLTKTIFRSACRHPTLFKLMTKKPAVPTDAECRLNRRSRSAKMRFIEKN